jgi:UDP-glucose 4-epimerase
MKKSVIITGVAGLLGCRMAEWILDNKPEYHVIGIDNLFGGYIENVDKRCEFYKRDLSTDNISDIFINNEVEYVFHFAAYAAEGLSPFMRMFNWRNNSVSTANVINQCIEHNVRRLVYTSSMSVYGHGNGKNRLDENDVPCPIDPYGVSKYACEMDIKIAGKQHGLDWCIIRPHNIYGEKQNIWDRYRNVLGIWMYQALSNKPMLIYGDGEQTRAFTYVADNLECLWDAATKKEVSHEIINLGGITPYTINEAARVLCEVTGYDKLEYREERYEAKWVVPTYEKSMNLLGFKGETSLKDGLANMWEWAKKQPERLSYSWNNYEINKGIYSYWSL